MAISFWGWTAGLMTVRRSAPQSSNLIMVNLGQSPSSVQNIKSKECGKNAYRLGYLFTKRVQKFP